MLDCCFTNLLTFCTGQQPQMEVEKQPIGKRKRLQPLSLGDLLNTQLDDCDDNARAITTDDDVATKEVNWYSSLPSLSDKNSDPLEWWRKHSSTFPTLSKLAKKYLCCPATSVPSERLFSLAGNIVSSKRNRLKPEKINKLCFLSANL